jgi:hypothetical protein
MTIATILSEMVVQLQLHVDERKKAARTNTGATH